MNEAIKEQETAVEIADCCGCGKSFAIDELYICDACGKAFCGECWEDHGCNRKARKKAANDE